MGDDIYIFTAHIRSFQEGNVFRHVCLSVCPALGGVPCDLSHDALGSKQVTSSHYGIGHMGPPGRTSLEGLLEGPGKEGLGTPLLEGPARKDCWKDLGRKAWVPPQLGRTAGRTWKGGPRYPPEGPAGKDCWKDLGRRDWALPQKLQVFDFLSASGQWAFD